MLKPYKKASNTLQRHWNQEARSLSIGYTYFRSNQCAERSIKVIQELYYMCKNKDKRQLRFILSKNTNFIKVLMLYLLIFAWYNNSQSKCVKVK